MIEVEKKFRPTDEQLEALIKDCLLVKEVVNHDIVYDYSDYRNIKRGIRLRSRNGKIELKISEANEDAGNEDGLTGASEEVEDEDEIKKYFDVNIPIIEFIRNNLIEGINIKTSRKKYKKDDFVIDIDELDFGYKCVEIELLVNDKSEIPKAYERILGLAKSYNFDLGPVPAKKKEYFRKVKPDVYNMLYGKG